MRTSVAPALLVLALGTLGWVSAPVQARELALASSPAETASDGQTFADVPPTHPYYTQIEWLYQNGYTAGCAVDPLRYCPDDTMNRAESAVFVERGLHSATHDPPTPANQVFGDLPLDSWAAKWVDGLWQDGYTAGCGRNPLVYCPWQGHTRAEGCVFYLRMLRGASYEPPQPGVQIFGDVLLDAWYAKWVQAAYEAGLITPCQSSPELKFCAEGPLSRGLAAYIMVKAKSGPLPGRFFYVSPSGSDSNPGTLEQPWKTIQKAADTMVGGDTTTVLAGDYAAQRVNATRSGSAGLPITFQAQGAVVMKGFKIVADYITVRGFEIANTSYRRWDSGLGAGVYVQGAYNTIENNYIHDASLHGIYFYGTPTDQATAHDNIVRNNRLAHNELVGIHVNGMNNLIEGNDVSDTVQCHPALTAVEDVAADNPNRLACPNYPGVSGLDADFMRFFGTGHIFRKNASHGIRIDPPLTVNPHIDCWQTWASGVWGTASDITFERNYCENLNQGMYVFMLSGGVHHLTIKNNVFHSAGGINTAGTGNADYLYVYNNLFAGNLSFTEYGVAIELTYVPHVTVKNNIFYDQPYGPVFISGDPTYVETDFNLGYNSNGTSPHCIEDDTGCRPISHNLWNVDPQFVDPATEDYHLQAGSPAIDAGTTLPDISNDYDGVPRPQGTGIDIGPFEHQAQ